MFTLLMMIVVCLLQYFGATKLNAFSISEVRWSESLSIYWVFPTKSKLRRSFMMKPRSSRLKRWSHCHFNQVAHFSRFRFRCRFGYAELGYHAEQFVLDTRWRHLKNRRFDGNQFPQVAVHARRSIEMRNHDILKVAWVKMEPRSSS